MIIKYKSPQIRINLISVILFSVFFNSSFAQKSISSDEALNQYMNITRLMEQSFSENDYKTYRRDSFSEQELQSYLTKHFQRLDLLPSIKGKHLFKLNSYLHSGNWFNEIGFPKSSIKWYNAFFEYYKENIDSLTVLEKEELVEKITYAYSVQASIYAKKGELTNAALVHKKNIKFVKDLNIISYPSALNNYGLFFYKAKKELDSALIYFNKAYDITKENFLNHTLMGSIRDNIADVYIDKNQVEKALVLYKKNFELYKQTKNEMSNQIDLPRLISAGSQLVETEIKLNRLVQANQSFTELWGVLENPKFKNKVRNSSKLEFFKAQEALLAAQNKFKAAYAIALKRNRFTDSLHTLSKVADSKWQDELSTISLDRVALKFKIDKIQKETIIRSQQLKLWVVTLSSILVLLVLIFLFIRRRQHLIIAKNKQQLAEQSLEFTALKNEKLHIEIGSKKRDLSDFAINLSQNQEWAKGLADKVESIKAAGVKEQQNQLDSLEQDIQNKITVDSNTKEFYERLDKLSDAFYRELGSRFPKLSKNEVRLCSLIRLKMDSRSIATMQNITLSSLNTSRYRLRKKLNLSEGVDLNNFIQNI